MRIRGRWKKNMGEGSTPTGEIKGRTPVVVSCPLRLGGIISLDITASLTSTSLCTYAIEPPYTERTVV